MPVFDFNNKPDKNSHGECTYTMLFSNASEASAESPILLLDNQSRQWKHHLRCVYQSGKTYFF